MAWSRTVCASIGSERGGGRSSRVPRRTRSMASSRRSDGGAVADFNATATTSGVADPGARWGSARCSDAADDELAAFGGEAGTFLAWQGPQRPRLRRRGSRRGARCVNRRLIRPASFSALMPPEGPPPAAARDGARGRVPLAGAVDLLTASEA